MRVVIDARLYGLENTGIGRYLINLIDGLQKDAKNEYVLLLRKKYFNKLNLAGNIEKVLVDVPHYGFLEQFKLPLALRNIKKDLVHFPHFNVPIFWRGKFVVTIHDMTMHKRGKEASKLSPLKFFGKQIFYKFIFGRALQGSKKIIVPSESVKKELLRYFKLQTGKIVVIYEGPSKLKSGNVDVLKKYSLVKNEYFFYMGNSFPHKNVSRLIEAMVYLNKALEKRLKLVIGSPHNVFEERIKDKAKSLGISGQVMHLGYVPDDEVRNLYKNPLL